MLERKAEMSSSGKNPQVLTWQADDGTRMVADCYVGAPASACLLLHGFWRARRHPRIIRIAEELAASGRTVVVPDLRGHGDSGGRFSFNRIEWSDLRGLDLPRDLIVVGLSMGAAIAVSATAEHILAPLRMLLISPASDYCDIAPDVLEMLRGGHVEREQRHWQPRIELTSLLTVTDRPDPSRQIARLECPVQIIHARRDWLVHHRHGEILARHCSGATIELLDEESGRRMHADRLVDHAWPMFRSLLRRFATSG